MKYEFIVIAEKGIASGVIGFFEVEGVSEDEATGKLYNCLPKNNSGLEIRVLRKLIIK
jgi:hypothetical protein